MTSLISHFVARLAFLSFSARWLFALSTFLWLRSLLALLSLNVVSLRCVLPSVLFCNHFLIFLPSVPPGERVSPPLFIPFHTRLFRTGLPIRKCDLSRIFFPSRLFTQRFFPVLSQILTGCRIFFPPLVGPTGVLGVSVNTTSLLLFFP